MAAFDEVQLDPWICQAAAGGPQYQTVVITTASGAEQRVGMWAQGRLKWDLQNAVKNPTQMALLVAFFRARGGRLRGFRFKDWSDYQATAEALVNPYPATTTQLQKTYLNGGASEIRKIVKPVAGSVTIYENGSPLTAGTHYTLDTTTGIVTFLGAKPVNGAAYTWTGQFDVPVRFDTDQMQVSVDTGTSYVWNSIPVLEILI